MIGPNGVGKTTVLTMLLGEEQPDAGTIRVGDTVRISYVDQLRAGIDPGKTVWEVIGPPARLSAMRTADGLRANGIAAAALFKPSMGGWIVHIFPGGIRQPRPADRRP